MLPQWAVIFLIFEILLMFQSSRINIPTSFALVMGLFTLRGKGPADFCGSAIYSGATLGSGPVGSKAER